MKLRDRLVLDYKVLERSDDERDAEVYVAVVVKNQLASRVHILFVGPKCDTQDAIGYPNGPLSPCLSLGRCRSFDETATDKTTRASQCGYSACRNAAKRNDRQRSKIEIPTSERG